MQDILYIDKDLDGITKLNNEIIKVPFSQVGDKVQLNQINSNKKIPVCFDFTLIEASKPKENPICKFYGKCGGCKAQHFSHIDYINHKKNNVLNALKSQNINLEVEIEFIHHLNAPKNQRRRVDLSVNGKNIGFKEYRSNKVVDIDYCPLITEKINTVKSLLRSTVLQIDNHEITGVHITEIDGDLSVMITSNKKEDITILIGLQELFRLDFVVSVFWKFKTFEKLMYKNPLYLHYGNEKIEFIANTFLQASVFGEKTLQNLVTSFMEDSKNILDLFSGYGGYAFNLLASNDCFVKAIDIDSQVMAQITKVNNRNLSTMVRNLMKNPLQNDELLNFQATVINPPRVGALEQVKKLAESNLNKIIMVYCSSSSLARDLQILKHYHIKNFVVVDQFIYSPHVELVVHLEK